MIDDAAIRERLRAELRGYGSPPRHVEQVVRRARRLRFRRRAVAAIVGGVMILGVGGPLLILSSLHSSTQSADTPPVNPSVVADVAVGGFPSAITTGDGSIWVAVEARSADQNVVARIDPATNDVAAVIPVDGSPNWLAMGDGSLWVALDNSVQRIDPETGHVIAEIRGPGGFVTSTPGSVWAVDSANSIARIDSTTNDVVATVSLGLPATGYLTGPPVGAPHAVWIMAFKGDDAPEGAGGELLRVDPNTNSVVARIDVDAETMFAVGDDGVWAVASYGPDRTELVRIDSNTNEKGSPIMVEGAWTPFAVGAGRLWLLGGMQPEIRLAWLDLGTLTLEGSIVVGELPAFEGSATYDRATDSIWVAQYERSVTRVDVRSMASPTIATVPAARNGVIAFGCGYHICSVMPDGSSFTDLMEPYDRDLVLAAYSPVFSPDGSRIAFRGYPRGAVSGGANYDLYVMNANGTGVVNLTTSPEDVQSGFSQFYAQWSPEGSMIAYDGDDGLYVMNADGSDQRKLASGANATWSPDGSWVAFVMGRDHGADLWKIHPDGTGLTQLTQSTGWDELPVWSPDGSRIAFLRDRAIYVVDQDGTGLAVVADIKGAYPFQPQWSPDGTMLAFEVEMPATPDAEAAGERNYDIFTVKADGTGLVDVTPTTDVTENYPIWSPDGTRIAFGASDVLSGENAGTFDLYTMNPDGSGIERLTTDAGLGVEFDISWQRILG